VDVESVADEIGRVVSDAVADVELAGQSAAVGLQLDVVRPVALARALYW
jgi:hypothetical protein